MTVRNTSVSSLKKLFSLTALLEESSDKKYGDAAEKQVQFAPFIAVDADDECDHQRCDADGFEHLCKPRVFHRGDNGLLDSSCNLSINSCSRIRYWNANVPLM